MTVDRGALASEVIATARAMGDRGINHGRSGNVSVRCGPGLLITPSSVDYAELTPEDLVEVDPDGAWRATNDRRPSSEWRFHRDVLAARPDAEAVLHAHPVNATALACHRRGIGSFHYMVAVAGGRDIRCAGYATFGTEELSTNVVAALDGRLACLLANHGVVAIGQYLAALAIGEPTVLSAAEMDEVLEKMSSGAGYGSI